ncbi:GAF domain-containing protein [Pseudotamlana carrageenivorans]|uniref:GAF domain-containing protein n=1 Tax=Pseudotamlana carrageenivorans TaxID=2069432 RepID=A0A2I7SI16_9FLAO|nr:GAF domain-containing protein [Tamlana carrageenivorans]AUS05504.1 GAF domain-containing protein [Tamlana carrageenivorans]
MDINHNIDSPLELKISFKKLLEQYEDLSKSDNQLTAEKAKSILNVAQKYPELRDGFSDVNLLESRKDAIQVLLQDTFNPLLTKNEIKSGTVPFHDLVFNPSERFQNIIKAAGEDFELQIEEAPKDDMYVIACTIILSYCYGYQVGYKIPFYYKIPDANGVMRHYKILYNADFCEILPKASAPKITEADYHELLDNFENIALWKEKFPPNSYIFKGFVISNIFDVTEDQSISNIKSRLLSEDKHKDTEAINHFFGTFKSLLGVDDIKVGVSLYDNEEGMFYRFYGEEISSYILGQTQSEKCCEALCEWSYNRLVNEHKYLSVSNVDAMVETAGHCSPEIQSLHAQGVKSAILVPIANDDELLGILEIVSSKPYVLNSINANKLAVVTPHILASVERSKREEENLIEAIIQKECTSIHPSVKWRFEQEAKNYIKAEASGLEPVFKRIAFENVYPLYGQIDIKGSSEARNEATKLDLTLQLQASKAIFKQANALNSLPIYEQFMYQIDAFLSDLKNHFQVDSEQQIADFFKQDIEPVFAYVKKDNVLKPQIDAYFESIDDRTRSLYRHRKNYDETIAHINREMALHLDEKQIEAQAMYPHFFERYKTDGVEHNMYIGESITKADSFNPIYLYNLRLWQLQVMCEMENAYYDMKNDFPVQLDVASLILVFNQPLSISFKMDEKQFDVDGTYNARYEIVKKRVDKAFIKGTNERLTQKGKISIVYSQKQDEVEYLRYIKFLQSKNYLDSNVEIVDLEDLQAVTGLKAIRVAVLYHKGEDLKSVYTYEDLMKTIKL